ncbi:MAG TPA: lipid A biosynthesis lauroyl acyltransferase [Rhizobiaceae bacterium]|nr:lipid A biosynthesis lauroyl acyltransferase [Rhizobiaceae bacterium]
MKAFLFRARMALKRANYWLIAQAAFAAMRALQLLPPERALAFADRFARRFGPWFGRHRTALDNLRQAYPEKSEAEIEKIASDMWGNMARLAAEYIFLDQLFDFEPGKPVGRVEVIGEKIFERIAGENRPHILFTGHLGNFELLPVAAAAYGLKVTAMFRPPNNPYLADKVMATRKATMGSLIASRAGAAFSLASILDNGGNIGVLVDQKFSRGLPTTFFGRECQTNPVLPKLARQFDCDVYAARSTRLPGNRFRLEIEEKLVLPREADGRVDVVATAQLLNDTVERWVREDPGQWMWFHKRWQSNRPPRVPRRKPQ